MGASDLACGERALTSAPPAFSTSSAEPSQAESSEVASASASATVTAPGPSGAAAIVQAVRGEHWTEAARLIDAESDAEKARPEVRFLRARVASALQDHAKVRALLEGLSMPLFEDDINRLKAEAAAFVGPYKEARLYYEAKGRPRDLVLAAQSAKKEGDDASAFALADRALNESQRHGKPADERAAHRLRSDLLLGQNKFDQALTDLQWLAIHAPHSKEGEAARQTLKEHQKKLSARELADQVSALSETGGAKDALTVLDEEGSILTPLEEQKLRAQALMKARQYTKAAEAYTKLAKENGADGGEALYYAGKALGRNKKEEQAIERYQEVIKRFHKTTWAERAAFQIGELHMLGGEFAKAEKAFTSYLANYATGTSRDEARYALALADLSLEKPAKAKHVFLELSESAKKTEIGTLKELAGVAALRAGDKQEAIQIFTQVAKDQPLTWGALVSRARLTSLGAPLPPVIAPPEARTSPPLTVELPQKARRFAELGLDADAEQVISENEQEASGSYGARSAEALCSMYGQLSRAKRRYKVGSQATSFDLLMHAPSPADRWMWQCVYPAPYSDIVTADEKTYDLPTGFVHAIMRQESTFDPDALSPVGAEGLMQLMPTTATQAATEAKVSFTLEEIRAPEQNIQLGAFYLGKQSHAYAGALPLAIAAYNAGPGAVSRWLEKSKEFDADVWVARIPLDETRNYVSRVMSNLLRYQWLAKGDSGVMEIPVMLPNEVHSKDNEY